MRQRITGMLEMDLLAVKFIYLLYVDLPGLDEWAARPSHLGFSAVFMHQRDIDCQDYN